MFSGLDSPSHWLVIALVVAVLFGYKKLPEMSRSVGRSLRIFKTEMKGMNSDDEARDGAEEPTVTPPTVTPPTPAAPPSVQAAAPTVEVIPAAAPVEPKPAAPQQPNT